ncbi:hypothetical protein A0J48_020415 [Sphaerospermopsis aphanizomenoides BCCUSP55]|uniref:hypothetical protein n=1 Tax=Sphaerospermopsis aphanizomenoides TaxID=459663 RepID=UPI0019030D52|nr:hypothetical protein [Sphaerospermopsis aphanizomenoides]MBK1989864.1 hypothetical protein [Sphaerospermopsis aphanizomenoides BCCUSP55]
MGYSLWSRAEVVTTEPEKVKDLILQIVAEGETTSVHNLEIKGNSIFFDSEGYGRYGLQWEERFLPSEEGLFAKLCEEYIGALVCFEAVTPCDIFAYNYYLSTIWIKPEGVVKPKINCFDDEDEEYENEDDDIYETDEIQTFYRKCHVLWWEDLDFSKDWDEFGDYEPSFISQFDDYMISLWFINIDKMEEYKDEMPDLYNAYIKAQADGFDDWAIPVCWGGDKSISYDVARKIGQLYSDEESVVQDCFKNMEKMISDQSYFHDAVGLPENFPKLSKLQ